MTNSKLLYPRYYSTDMIEEKYLQSSVNNLTAFLMYIKEVFSCDIDYPLLWPEHGSQNTSVWGKDENNYYYQAFISIMENDIAHYGDIIYYNDTGTCIIACKNCLINHVYPLVSDDFLQNYYKEKFYQISKPEYKQRYLEDYLWWNFTHAYIIKKYFNENFFKFLDYGCGIGLALDAAQCINVYNREELLITYGIEPCDSMHESLIINNHQVLPGFDGVEKFDIIYCYEVLEHVINPEELLIEFYNNLSENGIVVIVVPNDFNPIQIFSCIKYSMEPWWISPIEHINYFTPKTLQLLLRRCGFDIIEMRGTFPIDFNILNGENYVGNYSLGRILHNKRKKYEINYYKNNAFHILDRNYTRLLSNYRVGREIVCVAQRRG